MNHSTWCHIFLENMETLNHHLVPQNHPFEPDWISLNTSTTGASESFYEWIHYTISGLPELMVMDYSYDYLMTSM